MPGSTGSGSTGGTATPPQWPPLSPPLVRQLSGRALSLAMSGQWRPAVRLMQDLRAALAANPGPDAQAMRDEADGRWIEVAMGALTKIPDGRIYRSALAAGQRLEATLPPGPALGLLLHRLGALHLDPYTADRTSLGYAEQQRAWRERLREELAANDETVPEAELRMPAPSEALAIARDYLRRAADMRTGNDKGLSLKALAQACEWSSVVAGNAASDPGQVDRNETAAREAAAEALEYIDPKISPHQFVQAVAMVARSGRAIDKAKLDRIRAVSMDHYVGRIGVVQTMDLYLGLISSLQRTDAAVALDLCIDLRHLTDRRGDEPQRSRLLRLEANIAVEPMIAARSIVLGDQPVAEQYTALRGRAVAEQWDCREWCCTLLRLSQLASRQDQERAGIGYVDEAAEIAPLFFEAHRPAFDLLRISLLIGEAVNSINRNEHDKGVDFYSLALIRSLELELPGQALDTLLRVEDLTRNATAEMASSIVARLAPAILRVEAKLGNRASLPIYSTVKRSVAAFMKARSAPDLPFHLFQMVKGARFGVALYAGSTYRPRQDEQANRLLEQIAAAEREVGAAEAENADALDVAVDEDMLLSFYPGETKVEESGTPAQRLANLHRRFDAHVFRELLASIRDTEPYFVGVADVQAALGPRTVLIDFFLGSDGGGSLAVTALLMTSDEVKLATIRYQFPDSLIEIGEHHRLAHPLARPIKALRDKVQVPPARGPVIHEAAKTLASDLRGFLGYLVEHLERLRLAGKDHLLIHPQGPLHYYPFCLLGPAGKPLGADWIVTHLPNLHLMTSGGGTPRLRRRRAPGVSAIGLTFQSSNPFGLDPLPQCEAEARAVAQAFGATPLLDAQATKRAVLEALGTARWVHLSTHGQHNVEAPAFQCLFLAPDGSSDGRLFSHEILGLDLRGLDLLTLSACETALGRFDLGDNLRGLPAAFMLAGVATIVGTLWPVEPDPAALFFATLYQHLRDGASKLDAFGAAQRGTRAKFADYRHWGSFYLIGATD